MAKVKFVYWNQDGAWLGYLQAQPDFWTQGATLEDLKDHLRDLHADFASGAVAGVRMVAELDVG